MIIAVPKEIKTEEYRVGLTPAGAAELSTAGHEVLVQNDAGIGSGFSDDQYRQMGAEIVPRDELFRRAELVVKVKEPLPQEFELFREGQTLFTYLHLAPNPQLTRFLMARRLTALAYETLELNGALPLLAPMSEVAGRMAPLVAGWCLQRHRGGTGFLPTGAAGVRPAKAVILGGGTVGSHAARVAAGIGMDTIVLNRSMDRLRRIDELTDGRVRSGILTGEAIRSEIRDADLIIGAVLTTGGRTPLLLTGEMLGEMKKGAVIVDVSVDQGGCAATTRPTTHNAPTYIVNDIVHYAVANMPGAFPHTSTMALTNATLPYIMQLAARGIDSAIDEVPALATSVNVRDGRLIHPALAAMFTFT